MTITAIKPIFKGIKRGFEIEVHRDACILMAHSGYLVYDDPARTIDGIERGGLIYSWSEAKRAAVLAFLRSEVAK